jgi:glutamate/tyrosine decarboxylase-like PLP-dependent enzyme
MNNELASLLHNAATRSATYLAGLQDRSVAPTVEALAALAAFDEPLPAKPSDPAATLELLDRVGSPATVATAGGRYFGFVNGAALPSSVAAHILATAWDQNAALSAMSPVASKLRSVVSRWIVDVLGLPPETEAMFVGGATIANLAGLVAGRDHVLAQAGWDAAGDGLIGAPPLTVVVGQSAHATIGKALAIIGLGRNRVVAVPCDDQGRMPPRSCPTSTAP